MGVTVESFLHFIKERRGPKSVVRAYSPLLKNFEKWLLSQGKSIDDFTPADVEMFMSQLQPSTAKVFLSAIRQYARFRVSNAPDEHYTHEDRRYHALQNIKPPRIPKLIKKEALSIEELEQLLDLTSEDEPLHSGLVCLFYFGWRPVEATVNLVKGTVDWSSRYIKLMTAKAKHERLLPFSEKLTPYLRTWYDFAKGTLIKYSRAEEWLTKHLKPYNGYFSFKITARTARKTFETQMRKAGVEQWKIDFLMGHTTDIPAVYTDWTELLEDLREIMEEKHYMLDLI